MSRPKRILLIGLPIVIASIAAAILLPTGEYERVISPDGRYYAVASYPRWQSYLPMMPGGGGDKSGWVTIYAADGRSCGSAAVPMAWYIQDLRWEGDTASIRAVAEWDLVQRKAHIL